MADPTPDSNLALIEELQTLISADNYETTDGPELSYPAVGQAVDDEMWKFITLALGSGVLDTGGQPYWLRGLDTDSETNQANQMRLTVSYTSKNAQAVVGGFYHRLLRDIRIDLPMPLVATTYYIVLELNPLKASSPEGPISVQVYPNDLNMESGRQYVLLWTVTRKPNQLLTDATIQRIRPKVTPTITVDEIEHRPEPETVLWGTRCLVTGTGVEYRAQGSDETTGMPRSWARIDQAQGWTSLKLGKSYTRQGVTPAYRILNGYVEFRGTVRNTGGTDLPTKQYVVFGWLGSKFDLPDFNAAQNGSNARSVVITTGVGSTGVRDVLNFNCAESGTKWFSLDGIKMPIA